jgi:hypothetical protein
MTPYEKSQLLSMMQQMLADMAGTHAQMLADIACAHAQIQVDMAYTNAQIDAHLTKLENNNQELQSVIHNSQSPTFMTSVQLRQSVCDLQLTLHTPEP